VKRGLVVVVILALVAVFVAIAAYRVKSSVDRNANKDTGPDKAVSVSVAQAGKKDLPLVVSITGTVKAQNEAVVFPKMSGRVTRIAVDVGQVVKAGDVLATLEANDLAWRVRQAEAQVAVAHAGVENARVQQHTASQNWDRAQALHSKKATTEAEFEQAEASFHLAGVGIQQAEAQVAVAEAALGSANQALADSRITAPIAGLVARKNVDLGAQATPMQSAFVVQDQTALKVQGNVPAAEVARLKKGQLVHVTVDELPGRALDGELASIAPTLDSDTRRALVEVSLKPSEGLLPYMFGHAEIDFGKQEGVLVIPSSAVNTTSEGSIVYVVDKGKVSAKKPKLGDRVGEEVVVVDGLNAGDRVVVSGDSGLRDGVAVSVAGDS
jgi:RND family efflux transporter MFP subunit